MLDKSSALPLYVQLGNILRDEILKGNYKEGDLIPSETALSKKYDITRTTVRRALKELVNEGILSQVHGKGTYVCLKQMKYNIWNFGGFTEYITNRGESPISKILHQEIVEENGEEYFLLKRARGVKKGSGILYLTIDLSKVPVKIFPEIDRFDFSISSLYSTMRKAYGIYPKRAELKLNATMSDQESNGIFHLNKKVPLLVASGNVFDREDKKIEEVKVIYSDNIAFKIVANMDIY